MTVSTEVNENTYTGNGTTTVFPYQFRIFKKSDLVVQVIDLDENVTTLTLDTNYTVTGAGGYRGGNVTLMTPLASGWRISIVRELEITQDTDLRNQGKFFAETHEDVFDRLTMLIQQVLRRFGLALRKPSGIANYYDALGNKIRNLGNPTQAQDAATKGYVDSLAADNLNHSLRTPEPVPQLPPAEERANKIVAMDGAGRPIMVLPETGSAADVLIELAKPPGAGKIGYGSETVEDALDKVRQRDGFNTVGRFLNLSELRSVKPAAVDIIVYVASAASSSHAEMHFGGGFFQSVDNMQAWPDDGGIVIKPATGTLVWKRINFTAYDMQFWGVKADGGITNNAAAITLATNYARANRIILEAPAGSIHTSEMVPIYDNMGIRGYGKAENTVFYKTTNNTFPLKKNGNTVLSIDALVGYVPKAWDLTDFSMDSFCVHARLENCMFRRAGLSADNVGTIRPYYGLFLGKAASPVIRQVNIEGAYIGIKVFCAFSGVMEMVAAVQYNKFGFVGIDFSDYRNGTSYMSGTSMDMRLVQCRGYQFGFQIQRLQYSTMINCSCEEIYPMAGETVSYAFDFLDPYCVSMNGCATEFIGGGQIRVQGGPNPSYRPQLKITNYIAIDQQNPIAPTHIYYVDNGSFTPMNVVIEASELSRDTTRPNLSQPVVTGNGAKVIIIGCSGEDFLTTGSGVFTRLA